LATPALAETDPASHQVPAAEIDVRLEGIRKTYGDVVAVDRVDLEIPAGEFFTLLGPSGSGKTTTLRLIAGFERPDEGRIELGGADVTNRAPYERDVNTVFQDYALFPHMTVAENVAYGLRVKRVPRAERRRRVEEILKVVRLPEVGDRDRPKLVFFFDEAHLLFTDAPKALLDKIEQVIRLVRSKGVGVFFVTQNPLDVPDIVLGQLGNRVQHALRAFTPRDQKAVKAVASTMRANPALDTEKAITELGVGEALISFLDEKGRPGIVERAFILPPASRIGSITADERKAVTAQSPVKGVYDAPVDRESAYEKLAGRASASAGTAAPAGASGGLMDSLKGSLGGLMTGSGRKDSLVEAMAKSAVRTMGSTVGREIVRGVLGSLLGGRRR